MTRTRWLAALVAAALLGGSAGAQCVGSCAPATESNRAPYYYELTEILYPAHPSVVCPNSNPAVWARLFEAIAHTQQQSVCQAHCAAVSSTQRRQGARDRRMAFELLKLYRLCYREGQYHTAAILAERALQLDPDNVAAESALCMARLATDASAHAADGGKAEDCETVAGPVPGCGMGCCKACKTCSKTCCDECKSCGKAACAKCACGEKCACCKSSCACGEKCACKTSSCGCAKSTCCCTKGSCTCGDKCGCKKSGRQNVHSRPRVAAPPVPMMCPNCPVYNQVEIPMPGMMPPAMPMMPPQMPNVMGHNQTNFGVPQWIVVPCCPGQACPVMPPAERLPMPRAAAPAADSCPMPVSTKVHRGPIHVTVRDKQVCIDCPCLEACCNTVTSLADGRALLEGDVTVTFRIEDRPAKIQARRMIVDLETGAYEVNPARFRSQILQRIGHEEWQPCSKDLSFPVSKPSSPKSCDPFCPTLYCPSDR